MEFKRKRIFASCLALILVLSVSNGYGVTYVYASDNTVNVHESVQFGQTQEASVTITKDTDFTDDVNANLVIDGGNEDIVVTFDDVTVNGNIKVKGGTVIIRNSTINGTLSAPDATNSSDISIDSSRITEVTDINNLNLTGNPTFQSFLGVENLQVENADINIDISHENSVAPVFHNITGVGSARLHMYTGKGEIPANADSNLLLPKFTGTIDLGKGHEQFHFNDEAYDMFYDNQGKQYVKLKDAYYLREDFVVDEETGELKLSESAVGQQVSEDNLWLNEWNNPVEIEYISDWGDPDNGIEPSYLDLSKITTPYVELGNNQVAANLIAGKSPYIQPMIHNGLYEYYRTDMDGRVYLDRYRIQVNRYVNDQDNADHTAKKAFDNAWHNDNYCASNDVGYVGSIAGAISFIEADLLGEGASAPYYAINYHSNQTINIDVSALDALKGIRIISEPEYDEEQGQDIYPETNFQSIQVKEGQVVEFCKAISVTKTSCSLSGKGEISFLDCRINQSMVGDGEVIVATYNNTAFDSLKNVDTYAIASNAYFTEGIAEVNKVELRDSAHIFGGSGAVFHLPNVSSEKQTITDNSKDEIETLEGSGFDLRLYGCVDGSDKTTFYLTGTYDLGKGWNTHWNEDGEKPTFERVYYLEIQREDGGSDRENYVCVSDKWYHYENGEIGDEATDLDESLLKPDIYTQGIAINYYDNSEYIEAFQLDYDLWDINNKRVNKDGLTNKQVCSIEHDTLESIEYNLNVEFSDANYNFTDQIDWNGSKTVQMVGNEVGIFAVCYEDNTVTDYYSVLRNPMDYEGIVITKADYENYKNNGSFNTEGDWVRGSLTSILTKLKGEDYVYIRNRLGIDTQGDAINIPDNAHVIIDCGQNLGKINRIDLGEEAECILSGTFNGDILYNGSVTETQKTGMLTLQNCRIAGQIKCESGVDITIRNDNVVNGITNVNNLTLWGSLYVEKSLNVKNTLILKEGPELYLASDSTVTLNNIESIANEYTDTRDNELVNENTSLRLLYEYDNGAYPSVTITGDINLGKTTGRYWYDSNPEDENPEFDSYAVKYYQNISDQYKEYVYLNGVWNTLENDMTTPCEEGFDDSNLQRTLYAEGVQIKVYNSFKDNVDAVYKQSYNMHEAHDHIASSEDCSMGQLFTVDFSALSGIVYSSGIEFSNEWWHFDLATYHNEKKFIEKLEDGSINISANADDYATKKDGYIHVTDPKDYVAYQIDQQAYEDLINNGNLEPGQLLMRGTLEEITTKCNGENYLFIQQIMDSTSADDITVPTGCHYILQTASGIIGKLGTITVEQEGSLCLQGNYAGKIQYDGDDNSTVTREDDSQLALRNFWLDGFITGNDKGILTFIDQNTLCGISKIDGCNLLNSDNLDIIPNKDGKYEKVSFNHIYGNNGYHLSYSGYPDNGEQILVPEFTGDIELGVNRGRARNGTEYDIWYGQNDTRYILKDNVYYEIVEDDPEGYIVYKDEPADIADGDVWNHPNNISVTYYTPDTFYSEYREAIVFSQDDYPYENIQYMSFGSLEHGYDLASMYKVDCWDYGNYFIDIDGRLHNRDLSFLVVMGITEENFNKVGHDSFEYYNGFPTATAEYAMVIAKCAGFEYTGIEVNREDQTFTNLVVPENIKALAILSNKRLGYYPTYTVDSITLHNDQLLVFEGLHTKNLSPLNISMFSEGSSGTVRFIHSRVNQAVNGTKDVTVEVEENNVMKALTNFKQLIVHGAELTIEDELKGIDSIRVTADSSLIATSEAVILLPAIMGDSYYTSFHGNTVTGKYVLDIYTEQISGKSADITFGNIINIGLEWETYTDESDSTYYLYEDKNNNRYYGKLNSNNMVSWYQMVEDQLQEVNTEPQAVSPVLSDRYYKIIPYNYSTDIYPDGMYGESALNFDELLNNQLSYEDIETKIFSVDKNFILRKAQNALFGSLRLCYSDVILQFDGEKEQNFTKNGTNYKFWAHFSDEDTGEEIISKKYAFCNADFTDIWNKYSVKGVSEQTYTGDYIKPEVSLSSTSSDFQLRKDIDYKIVYTNNLNVGKATVTIQGLGLFSNCKKLIEFKIVPRNIIGSSIGTIASQTYTGSELKPVPKVTLVINGKTLNLQFGKDFICTYSNNLNVGTATVTITAKGNYTGSKKYVTFKINPKTIAPTISKISSQYYSGKALKPSVTVKYGTKTLKLNTDYTVSYRNHTNVGTPIVTITGKGNYKFTKTIAFTITLKKGATYTIGAFQYKVTNASGTVTLVKSTNTKATSITIANTVKIGGKTCVISAIGDKVFRNHQKVTKVTVGTGVTSIGAQAFENCGKLKSIVINSSKLKTVGKKAFNGIYKKATIKVPKAKLTAYQKLMKGKGQKSTVKITK